MRKLFAPTFGCALFAIAITDNAVATVTQVDGTILPVSNRLQIFLDTQEVPGAIDAVLHASEFPQIFTPNMTQPVVFRDVGEGAGFENSFGWYNVGDDIQTPAGRTANLHPIMGCGVAMGATATPTQHAGNPLFYVQNAEPGSQVSVDFAAELTDGRYKGGFIAFYLITPENNPSSANCGDFKSSTGDGLSLFGFIYSTQKDLNNDGDFVHHLVYQSPATANRFYFGFEDLFRGGDNDYEDMLMRVDGLTPPCIPQAEVCDTIDNDCDGLIDGADGDLVGVDDPCTCDGVTLECDNGPVFGQCQSGVTVCNAGEIECHATGTGSAEVCNGIDDNCDSFVDNNPSDPTIGNACDGTDADLCPEGAIVCQGGLLVCNDVSGPNPELCNGIDDDCDGPVDEGNPGGGGSCGSSVGECDPGTLACVGGDLECVGEITGTAELCNGLDDNCNGVVDDGPTDVGQPCGATDEGECEFGQTICVSGGLSCAGEVGPQPELCNGDDDDCDGTPDDMPVDEGQPCGSSTGACDPGAFVCTSGTLVCSGGVGPTAETCNAIDDDCNGTIDDNVPGEGVACGPPTGPCSGGMTACIDGVMECVGGTAGGTEVCNDIDDDCDGLLDEGDLCDGGVCDNGVCASQCLPEEFPCPPGKRCVDDYCVDDPCYQFPCPPDADGNLQTCVEGACVQLCTLITCGPPTVCRGTDGACVPDNCDYLPQQCTADQICLGSTCVVDPCLGVTCGSDQFCRGGECVASCDGIACPAGFACSDGACVATGCAGDCGEQVCNPDTGLCQPSACGGVMCPPNQVCVGLDGSCIQDPCLGVACPGDQVCSNGQCGLVRNGVKVTVGGGGGCSAGGSSSAGWLVIVAFLFGLAARPSTRQRSAALVVVASVAALGGCGVNEYCLDCYIINGDGGYTNGDGGSGDGGGDGDAPIACDPNVMRPEVCNNADDDCDSMVDEGFDLVGDELNCGACGTECNKPGAQTTCQLGACMITGCFPGFVDRDGDTAGPYDMSNGCELMCFTSNGGIEACDGLDNDCDSLTDETFDLDDDDDNCGECGRVCDFFQATGHCTASTCAFDPLTDCNPGYHDEDGMQSSGCEYQCTATGAEQCDLEDNDCDGIVDNGFDLVNDASNCGDCGVVCQFPHTTPSCIGGACGFDPLTDCDAGYVDVNGNQLDGCEYECTATNGGIEICDAIDNDCDGVADDDPVDDGAACSSTGGGPVGACVADGATTCAAGVLVCSGATEPSTEICDNVDNDCDGPVDDSVTRTCYTGPMGTSGVGVCRDGTETCTGGMFGACAGEVVPTAEQCNNLDDDCDTTIDNGPGGNPITQSCYGGPGGTDGVGTCVAGVETCAFGAFGPCVGEVQPASEVCGDNLDTDCDDDDDTEEGCLVLDPELRLDASGAAPGGGSLGSAAGARHSYDLVFGSGGSPRGTNLYAAWSELVSGVTEVYFRRSTDGGLTWSTIVNLTSGVTPTAVKPVIAVSPGSPDLVVVAYQTVSATLVRDIRVQVSSDGGATFGAASSALDASGDSFHHAVAASGTTIVVTWERLDTTTLNRDVISRSSTNSGASFNAEVAVNSSVTNPTRFAGRPQVGITSGGGIVWAWREQRSGSTRDIFAVAVASATTAPGADTRIDNDTLDRRDSDFPVMRVEGTRAYLVWQDVSTQPGGGADAMFARGTGGGTAWGSEQILDDPAGELSASFTPSLAVDPRAAGGTDDVVAVAWEDRRQGTQVFSAVSVDGAATFVNTARRVSSETGDPIAGETSVPQIATGGDGVLVVAYQNRLTTAGERAHVYVASSIDFGATWTHSHARADTGAGAAVAPQCVGARIGGGAAGVAGWTDFRAGSQINGDPYVAATH